MSFAAGKRVYLDKEALYDLGNKKMEKPLF